MSRADHDAVDLPFDELANVYLDNALSEQESERFVAMLRSQPALMLRFVELAQLSQMIDSEVAYLQHAESFDGPVDSGDVVAAMALAELTKQQAQAVGGPTGLDAHRKSRNPLIGLISGSDRTKAGLIVGGGLAAIIAMTGAIALVVGLLSQPTNQSPTAGHDDPSAQRVVATLIGSTDARWVDADGDAIAIEAGASLGSMHKLTLADGFAQVRTNDGAIAVLEAPAAIELLDHDNAVYLHQGKLVGICETESSKGFLVRTPHMDITDLGTRFGVDADSRETQVHVLEGEVQALRPDASADIEPTVLATGQSARTSIEVITIDTIAHDADRFAALMPEAIRSMSDWQIVAVNGQPLDKPGAMKIAKPAKGAPWITAEQGYPQQANDETTFTVQTRLGLPAGIDVDTATLLLQFDANDRVSQVRLNRRVFTPPANSRDDGHDGMHTMRIDGALLAGQNTLQLDVVDIRRAGATKWELRVDWSIQTKSNPVSDQPGGQQP